MANFTTSSQEKRDNIRHDIQVILSLLRNDDQQSLCTAAALTYNLALAAQAQNDRFRSACVVCATLLGGTSEKGNEPPPTRETLGTVAQLLGHLLELQEPHDEPTHDESPAPPQPLHPQST